MKAARCESGAVTRIPLPGAAQPGDTVREVTGAPSRWAGRMKVIPFPLDSVRVSAWAF